MPSGRRTARTISVADVDGLDQGHAHEGTHVRDVDCPDLIAGERERAFAVLVGEMRRAGRADRSPPLGEVTNTQAASVEVVLVRRAEVRAPPGAACAGAAPASPTCACIGVYPLVLGDEPSGRAAMLVTTVRGGQAAPRTLRAGLAVRCLTILRLSAEPTYDVKTPRRAYLGLSVVPM